MTALGVTVENYINSQIFTKSSEFLIVEDHNIKLRYQKCIS